MHLSIQRKHVYLAIFSACLSFGVFCGVLLFLVEKYAPQPWTTQNVMKLMLAALPGAFICGLIVILASIPKKRN